MRNQKLTVRLSKEEFDALATMSQTDCRNMREELRFLVQAEAHRRGLEAMGGEASESRPQPEGAIVDDVKIMKVVR